ncbi:response regulator transcription factor [Phaeodactylibacter sp.]|uniref:response regulator transcription factor n=1 Tax=Phaeodactylibacter sp. TaxID=1940289 RepID=UPI0025E019CA|nr:response regulator transcription factor [Phaeodactylibacter sp.]MCI4651644.1 response regulator transcription factor [Phaeodactylibacter sp.]MCI5090769.1 response regulator transcription factor [Phaeodactylibacter sp.]
MKVLLIGAESSSRLALQRYLKRQGLEGQTVAQPKAAVQKVLQVEFDAVVITEPLEKGNAMRLGQLLRQQEMQGGLLLLTPATLPAYRIEALESGYDDVLSLPYDLAEAYARLKAIVRRRTGLYQRELRLEDLVIRPDEATVWIGGQRLELTKKEFNILFFLARNRNRVISKDQLIDYLWGEEAEDIDGYDFLYAHLKNLRRKLKALGAEGLIETLYGMGYILRS